MQTSDTVLKICKTLTAGPPLRQPVSNKLSKTNQQLGGNVLQREASGMNPGQTRNVQHILFCQKNLFQ